MKRIDRKLQLTTRCETNGILYTRIDSNSRNEDNPRKERELYE